MTRWMGTIVINLILVLTLSLAVTGCSKKQDQKDESKAASTADVNETSTREATEPVREKEDNSVTIYVSVDKQVAEPILKAFEESSGIRVLAQYDTELTKTTGLVARLRDEHTRGRPNADVFWSGEPFNTIRLAEEGVFEKSNAELDFTPRWKDQGNLWFGFAARARVLAYASDRVKAEELPHLWMDLANPRFSGRLAMANPAFGTTEGHIAALYDLFGEITTDRFLEKLAAENILIVGGNSLAVQRLVDGEVDFAVTDTDDVWAARGRGEKVEMLLLRHTDLPGGGPMFIPNTLARVAECRHPEAADKLISYLLSKDVERTLAESYSHNFPTHPDLLTDFPDLSIEDPLDLPLSEIAGHLDDAIRASNEILGK